MSTVVSKTGGQELAGRATGKSLQMGYDVKDLILPRAILLQFTPPKNINVEELADGFKPGRLIDNLSLAELPKRFVPIFVRTKWLRFNAQETTKPGYDPAFELGAKIWESTDPLDPRVQAEGQWGPNNEPPIATKFLEFFCMFEGMNMPVLLSFAKTSLEAGKKLLSLARFSGEHMFSNTYELGTKLETNKMKQQFYVLTVKRLEAVKPEDLEKYGAMFESFAANAQDIKVHGEENEESSEAATTAAGEKSTERPY